MRTLCRSNVVAVLLAAAPPAIVLAQDPPRSAGNLCFRARPAPRCSAFFITNAGAYLQPARTSDGNPLRVMVDWGVMVNKSPRYAIGGSWFVAFEEELTTGPVVRYRRWFAGNRSLDVAAGTVVASGDLKPGSIVGLVKYNPVHWFGVGVRPEYSAYRSAPEYAKNSVRVSGGVEFGWVPGIALMFGGVAALGIFIAAMRG